MKAKIFMSTLVVVTLVVTAIISAPHAEAAQKNKTWNSFPGNSLYGRMHNPHFMYKWGGEEFETFDELVAYIREYLVQSRWAYRHGWASTTTPSLVDVTTLKATDITDDSATLRGKIALDDGEEADVWFEYGTRSTALTSKTTAVNLDDEDDAIFEEDVDGLQDGTRYYFRAVAEDENGRKDYGTILSFYTVDTGIEDEIPTVVTRSPGEITDDSIVLRGRVEMNDFDNGFVFFVYGTDKSALLDVENDFDTYEDIDEVTSDDALLKVEVEDDLDSNASYEEEVTGLDGNTTYYYRIGIEYDDGDGDTLLLGGLRTVTTE